jgi:hypothetical protein
VIGDLFFVFKMFVITCVIVVIAQVKIGQKSLEDHFQGWLKTSIFVDTVQEAIDGGVLLTKAGYKKADTEIHGVLAKVHSHHLAKSTDRLPHFSLKRFTEKADEDFESLRPSHKKPMAESQSPQPQ